MNYENYMKKTIIEIHTRKGCEILPFQDFKMKYATVLMILWKIVIMTAVS